MTLNNIKKALCKEKPIATLYSIDLTMSGEIHRYRTLLFSGITIVFSIKRREMGDKQFDKTIESHLLIRWIDANKTTKL